jgi:hypothetical protein
MGVFRNIGRVIVVNKFMTQHLPINSEGSYDKKQPYQNIRTVVKKCSLMGIFNGHRQRYENRREINIGGIGSWDNMKNTQLDFNRYLHVSERAWGKPSDELRHLC